MKTLYSAFDVTEDDGFGARLLIDLGALAENWRVMRRLSAPARCSAVVKADGYGLGMEPVIRTLYDAGCRDFFVATAHEGEIVRKFAAESRIFVMNCLLPGIEPLCRSADLIPVLASMEHVAIWTQSCIVNGDHPCALQIDTGMNRLGITVKEAHILAGDVTRPAGFSPVLIMSHLVCGDDPDHTLNDRQLEHFTQISKAFAGVEASLSNSAGILLGEEFRFDLTRPGIALYGGQASTVKGNVTMPVVTALAHIVTIRTAAAGETVSYGAAGMLHRDSRLAVCSVGYADGYLRAVSGAGTTLRGSNTKGARGYVLGHNVPVVGRVTMDLTIFDVTDIPADLLKPGDSIELFGHNVPLDDVAAAADTIGYELLTSLGSRYRRHYTHSSTG
ncbi:MAG: alanine racemase [Alphaproteobacteria bacterium]|nr:alanine racemase [Alphaproteobacteria bacterium]